MNTDQSKRTYTINLNFEEIKLPPFQDILLLAHKCHQGKEGISKCFHLLEPEQFKLIEVEDEVVEAMLVNKAIIKRISVEKIIEVLSKEVFPFIQIGEIIRVDFKVKVHVDNIKGIIT